VATAAVVPAVVVPAAAAVTELVATTEGFAPTAVVEVADLVVTAVLLSATTTLELDRAAAVVEGAAEVAEVVEVEPERGVVEKPHLVPAVVKVVP
jgi:hypothetical protein